MRTILQAEIDHAAQLGPLLRLLLQNLPLESLLEAFLDRLLEALGTHRGAVLLDRGGCCPELVAWRNPHHGVPQYCLSVVGQALAGQDQLTLDAAHEAPMEGLQLLRTRSILCVGIRVEEHVVGAIYLDYACSQDYFKYSHLAFVRQAADLLGVALERHHHHHKQLLEHKLSATDALLAGLNHELGYSLTSVIWCAQHLNGELLDPDHRELASSILHDSLRCQTLLAETVRACRRQPARSKQLCLNECVRSVVHLCRTEFHQAGVHLDFEPEEGMPLLVGIREHLVQVVLNLVQNARRAVSEREGGRVLLRTNSRPDRVRLQVQDNGPGVKEEHRHRLFDPFFTTQEGRLGGGMGLALVSRVASEHGGSVRVHNHHQGGAVFTLELPRSLAVAEAAA